MKPPYKFVTREDVKEQFNSLSKATEGVHGSAIIIGLAAHLRHLCEHAIAERDAYREMESHYCDGSVAALKETNAALLVAAKHFQNCLVRKTHSPCSECTRSKEFIAYAEAHT